MLVMAVLFPVFLSPVTVMMAALFPVVFLSPVTVTVMVMTLPYVLLRMITLCAGSEREAGGK
jgi:hypothetical protein